MSNHCFFKNNSISSVLPFSSTCGGVQLQRQAFNALQCPIQLSSSAAEDWGNCHLQLIACFCGRSPPSPSKPGGNTATIYLSSKMHKLHLSTAHCTLIFNVVLIYIANPPTSFRFSPLYELLITLEILNTLYEAIGCMQWYVEANRQWLHPWRKLFSPS